MRYRSSAIVRWRIAAAFVIAPLVGSFAFACLSPAYQGLDSFSERILRTTVLVVFISGYPPALIFGMPAFLILRWREGTNLLNCTLSGLVVAALPWVLGVCFLSNPDWAVGGGHVTVESGARTWWGWMEALSLVGQSAAFGALAGAVFWLLAAAGVTTEESRSASTP